MVIAKIPSREVLLSKLLGSLQSPITNLLVFSIRSLKKVEDAWKQLRQQKKLQKPELECLMQTNNYFKKKIKKMEEIKMAKLTTEEFIEAIKELSVLELNDLSKSL